MSCSPAQFTWGLAREESAIKVFNFSPERQLHAAATQPGSPLTRCTVVVGLMEWRPPRSQRRLTM